MQIRKKFAYSFFVGRKNIAWNFIDYISANKDHLY